jgi:hypothetical protein
MAAAQFVFLLPGLVSDLALRNHWIGNAAGDFFGGTTPYSPLWYVFNPFYWTQLPYKLYTMALVMVMTLVYWKLYKKGKMSFTLIYLWEVQNVIWYSLHITENVTVTLFAPLAMMMPVAALMAPLLKLPIGWSWNLSDSHWHCVFAWPGGWYSECAGTSPGQRWLFFGEGSGNVYTYIMLALWFAVPLLFGMWKRRKAGKKPEALGSKEQNERKWRSPK